MSKNTSLIDMAERQSETNKQLLDQSTLFIFPLTLTRMHVHNWLCHCQHIFR